MNNLGEVVEEGTIHFTVDGGGMTELARNILLSEDPGRAWRIMSALIGDGSEDVGKAVLDGTMKLVNAPDDDTLLMAVDENKAETEAYLRDLRYIYAGRIRMDRTWWRPCAVVAKYGPRSCEWAQRKLGKGLPLREGRAQRVIRAWSDRRAEFFCDKLERAILMGEGLPPAPEAGHQRYVIWETCGEPPHWWPPNNTPEEALADSRKAGRRLYERGEDVSSHEIVKALEHEPGVSIEEANEIRNLQKDADSWVRQAEYEITLVKIGEKVREQAGDDTFVLVVPADAREHDALGRPVEPVPAREVVVPRAPFVCWALSRTSLRHLSPPWDLVARSGVKMMLDDPYHTDWMLGAGLDLSEDYGISKPVTAAAHEELYRLQEELGNFEAAVLVDYGPVSGIVGNEILVLPDLSPDHAEAAMEAKVKAIITERGGQLAHLAIVGRETGWTIMRVPDATTRYPEGVLLTLNPADGTIRSHT